MSRLDDRVETGARVRAWALVVFGICVLGRAAEGAATPGDDFAARVRPETENARRARERSDQAKDLAARGREADAVREYSAALELDPDAVEALHGLAWIRATSSDPALRRADEAIVLAERLVTLTHYRQRAATVGRNWPKAFKVMGSHTLAAAFAAGGRFDEAVGYASQGLEAATRLHEVAPSRETEELVADSRWFLELYRSHQTYRERPRPTGAPPVARRGAGVRP